MTPEVAAAIEIMWRNEGGKDEPPEADRERLLAKVREREEAIERHVVQDMLVPGMSEGRRVPRRHQAVAMMIIVGLLLLAGLVALILDRGALR